MHTVWQPASYCRTTVVWRTPTPDRLAGIEGIAIDVGASYLDSVVVDGKNKVVFDKYDIVKYLREALDQKSADPSVESTPQGSSVAAPTHSAQH